MKKLFVLPVLCGALLAGCASQDNTVEVLGQKCEKIATGAQGDFLVKCPLVPELDALRNADKNSMFLSVNADVINFEEIVADTEHVYIDVIPANTMEDVAYACYRVLGLNPTIDGEAWYAAQVCEQ